MLSTSPNGDLRGLAGVLLRRVLLNDDRGTTAVDSSDAHFYTMSVAAQTSVADGLLAAMQRESVPAVQRRLCDTLAEVALLRLAGESDDKWPALWSVIHTSINGGSVPAQESAMLLLEMLGDYIACHMVEQLGNLRDLLALRIRGGGGSGVGTPASVRVGAGRAATAILVSIPTPSSATAFAQNLVRDLLGLLRDLMSGAAAAAAAAPASPNGGAAAALADDDAPALIATCLIDIADVAPSAFKPVLGDAVVFLCGIASASMRAPNGLRRLCVEALTTLAESSPAMVRKLPGDAFLQAVLPVCMGMLLETGEEDPADAAWEAVDPSVEDGDGGDGEDGDDEDDAPNNFRMGEEALDRIGAAVGAKRFMPAVSHFVTQYLDPAAAAAAPGVAQWKYRNAGLATLSLTAHLVDDSDERTFASVAAAVSLCVKDASARVRHQALDVLYSFCTQRAPAFQSAQAPRIAPCILRGLCDASRRVRGTAAYALSGYTEALDGEVDREALEPYLRGWLEALFRLVESPGEVGYVKEAGLTAASSLIAAAGGELVSPLYDAIMPCVLRILNAPDTAASAASSADGSEEDEAALRTRLHGRRMKGKALEALSIVGAAVGHDVFAADAASTMAGLIELMRASTAPLQHSDTPTSSGSGGAHISGDDPVATYLWDAIGRVCVALGAPVFAPYLPHILPSLLSASAAGILTSVITMDADSATGAVTFTRPDGETEEEDIRGEYSTLETAGKVSIRVKTAALEEKLSLVTALVTLAEVMRGPYCAPYARSLAQTLIELVRTSGTCFDDVRVTAASGLNDAMASCAASVTAKALREAYAALGAPCAAAAAEDDAAAAGAAAVGVVHTPPAVPGDIRVLRELQRTASSSSASADTLAALEYICIVSEAVETLRAAISEAEQDVPVAQALLQSLRAVLDDAASASNYAGGGADAAAPSGTPKGGASRLPLLQPSALRRLTTTLLCVRSTSLQRRAVRAAEVAVGREDMDETALEGIAEKDAEDEGLLLHVSDSIGALVKTHGDVFMPVYVASVAQWVAETSPAGPHAALLVPMDRRLSVFLMDDVLEFTGGEALVPSSSTASPPSHSSSSAHNRSGAAAGEVPLYTQYLPALLIGAGDTRDSTLRQACLYGLGAAAQGMSRAAFAHYGPVVVSALTSALLRLPLAQRGTPEDNGVSSIGKVLMWQMPAIATGAAPVQHTTQWAYTPSERGALMAGFLEHLPLQHDEGEEAETVRLLCAWLSNGDPDVLNAPPAHHSANGSPSSPSAGASAAAAAAAAGNRLLHILSVFGYYLRKASRRKAGNATGEAVARALRTVQQSSSFPSGLLAEVWGRLAPQCREALSSLPHAA